ncbi:MAG TPA: site-specific integrase, partial [Leptolinea sp.]
RKSGFITKEDAWAAAKELERKSNAGIDIHGDQVSCGLIMERWFNEHCTNLANTTKCKYSKGIDRLRCTFIYDTPVRRVNPAMLNTLINNLQDGAGGLKQLSIRTAVMLTEALRLSLSWATQLGIIPTNPIQNSKLPKIPRRQQKILNDDDIDDLVTASANNPFRIPLFLAIYGGLRREEAAALRWCNVDFKHRTITIQEAMARNAQGEELLKDTKNQNSMRTISLPRFVLNELDHMPKTSARVCVTEKGKPYRVDSYPQAIRRLIQSINAKRVGTTCAPMPLATYHDLRHTHAAMLIRMGIQPKVIQERLGHASIKITMDTYGYLMSGLQEGVADALDTDFQARINGRKSGRKPENGYGNTRVCELAPENPKDPKNEELQKVEAL